MIRILVVVEEGLVRTEVICTSGKCFVLILIVVEDGLVPRVMKSISVNLRVS